MQLRIEPVPDSPVEAAPKSAEILRGVRAAFVEKGFDGASMQDLARAAGMSVGNFYRYFPSKDAIVAQMIALDMAEIEGEFARVIGSASPMKALRALIAQRISRHHHDQNGQLWAEIAAAAQRKPEIARCACHMEATVTAHLSQVFAADTGLPLAEIEQRFAAEAAFVIMLIRSAAMFAPHKLGENIGHGTPLGHAPTDLNPLILRTINQVLDQISSAGLKGK